MLCFSWEWNHPQKNRQARKKEKKAAQGNWREIPSNWLHCRAHDVFFYQKSSMMWLFSFQLGPLKPLEIFIMTHLNFYCSAFQFRSISELNRYRFHIRTISFWIWEKSLFISICDLLSLHLLGKKHEKNCNCFSIVHFSIENFFYACCCSHLILRLFK